MKTISPKDRIIIALDYPTEAEAMALVEGLGDSIRFYKIGLQLFTLCGPALIRRLKAAGAKVFLDLKLHDIPNTVKSAVRSACEVGVDMMTVHLSGGSQMIKAASDAAEGRALVLGVTVLTSSTQETLREVSVECAVEEQVTRLASLASENGLGGVVASPLEVGLLRKRFGQGLAIVTPGIRPSWAQANDQQRTLTPAEAVRAGADYLVIGRPITAQPDPKDAAARIILEMSE